jgi:glycerol-3-phosphate dehydrogenase
MGDGRSSLADAVYAVRHEGAVGVSDVTLRRTHLAWFTTDHARLDAPRIAQAMGKELGWSQAQIAAEVERHERELVAEGL